MDNRVCTVKILEASLSAEEFGTEVKGKINGRENNPASIEDDDFMFMEGDVMPLVIVENENGETCRIPEKDVERIYC